jgi:hypothetical protein
MNSRLISLLRDKNSLNQKKLVAVEKQQKAV